MEDNPPYPFQRVKRVDGKDTGVLAIIAPFYDLDYYKVTSSAVEHCCAIYESKDHLDRPSRYLKSFPWLLSIEAAVSKAKGAHGNVHKS